MIMRYPPLIRVRMTSTDWTKSALLPLNTVAKNTNLTVDIPVCTSFTYLGITIYHNFNRIIQENFLGMKKKIMDDLKRRGFLYVSLQGRVTTVNTTVKMNIFCSLSLEHRHLNLNLVEA